MPQAVDSPTDRPTKDQCSVMVTNLKITVVNLYSALLHRTDERIRRRDRDPDGDEQSQQGALQTGKKQKVQPVGLANQCRDVLIEW